MKTSIWMQPLIAPACHSFIPKVDLAYCTCSYTNTKFRSCPSRQLHTHFQPFLLIVLPSLISKEIDICISKQSIVMLSFKCADFHTSDTYLCQPFQLETNENSLDWKTVNRGIYYTFITSLSQNSILFIMQSTGSVHQDLLE